MASFFYIFNGTGSVYDTFVSVNLRNNKAQAHIAMWARASLFRRFTNKNVAYTEPVPLKYAKLAAKYPRIYGHFYSVAYCRACVHIVVVRADGQTVGVDLVDHVLEFVVAGVLTERPHHHSELLARDVAVLVAVEQLERAAKLCTSQHDARSRIMHHDESLSYSNDSRGGAVGHAPHSDVCLHWPSTRYD